MAFNGHEITYPLDTADEIEQVQEFEEDWEELVKTTTQVHIYTAEHSVRRNYHLSTETSVEHIQRESILMECRAALKTRIEEGAMLYIAKGYTEVATDVPDEFGVTIEDYDKWYMQSQTLQQEPFVEINRLQTVIEAIEKERLNFNLRLYRNFTISVATAVFSRAISAIATIKDVHNAMSYSSRYIQEERLKKYAEKRIKELRAL